MSVTRLNHGRRATEMRRQKTEKPLALTTVKYQIITESPNILNDMKRTIAIVAGGDSSEHDVSMRSAEGILSFMDKEKYD